MKQMFYTNEIQVYTFLLLQLVTTLSTGNVSHTSNGLFHSLEREAFSMTERSAHMIIYHQYTLNTAVHEKLVLYTFTYLYVLTT